MRYFIDVVTTPDRDRYLEQWRVMHDKLRPLEGFFRGELFEKQRDIRNAHYDFVSVLSWSSPGDAEMAALAGFKAPALQGDLVEPSECQLRIQLGDIASDSAEHGWLINPFEITAEQAPAVLDMWDKAKDFMVAKPGFLNARLFQNCNPSGKYQLINVAEWTSAEIFMDALENKGYDEHREKSMDYKLHPSLSVPRQLTTSVEAA